MQWFARRDQGNPRRPRNPSAGPNRLTQSQDLVLVPAFVGLGAPYWKPDARGAIFWHDAQFGPRRICPRGTGVGRLPDPRPARGDASRLGAPRARSPACAWMGAWPRMTTLCSFLSDIIGAPVDRPQVLETTALGAAWLAGQRAGRLARHGGICQGLADRGASSPPRWMLTPARPATHAGSAR